MWCVSRELDRKNLIKYHICEEIYDLNLIHLLVNMIRIVRFEYIKDCTSMKSLIVMI